MIYDTIRGKEYPEVGETKINYKYGHNKQNLNRVYCVENPRLIKRRKKTHFSWFRWTHQLVNDLRIIIVTVLYNGLRLL